MDPFTIALATFGVQKLRGKSTKRALRDAAILGGGAYGLSALAPGTASSIGLSVPGQASTFSQQRALADIGMRGGGADMATVKAADSTVEAAAKSKGVSKGLKGLLEKAKENKFETALLASSVLPFLSEEEEVKPLFTEEDYKKAYEAQSKNLEGAFTPASSALPSRSEVFGSNMFYANEGGLAEMVKHYNNGGINYLPSKTDHDENDVNNYVRASGYVEDGAGNGNKDEDTMLAQLADGEFVSRADAVLGAGILSGGDPKSYKSMRKAGANFFYDQQKKFKRVFDLLNASKKTEN